jgi:hypothetical protein
VGTLATWARVVVVVVGGAVLILVVDALSALEDEERKISGWILRENNDTRRWYGLLENT